MRDPLFWPYPPKLAIRYEIPPGLPPVFDQRIQSSAIDPFCDTEDGGTDYLIASSNRKGLTRSKPRVWFPFMP